jgi:hypothetical protein
MKKINDYIWNIYESLVGHTQQKLDWYEDRYLAAMEHIDFLHAVPAPTKPKTKSAIKKPVVKKTSVKKATKTSGN